LENKNGHKIYQGATYRDTYNKSAE